MDSDTSTPRRFPVALSFPGERRDFVEAVAGLLAEGFGQDRILYDHYHDDEFARPNLNVYLPRLYRKESELIAVFLCPEYPAKLWCKLEWRHIAQLLATAEEKRIMFFSFGNPGDVSDLGILSGDGYIDIEQRKLNPQEVAGRILKRLSKEFCITPPPKANPVSKTESALIQQDLARIDRHAPEKLIGRTDELALLDQAWKQNTHVLAFVAMGGEGKTSLVAKWAADLVGDEAQGCEAAFAWSFYSQGSSEQSNASADWFLREALVFFGDVALADSPRPAAEKGKRLAELVGGRRALLVLDGLEPLQHPPASPLSGQLKDPGLSALLKNLALRNRGLCLVTTRYRVQDLNKASYQTTAPQIDLKRLSPAAGMELLERLGVRGRKPELEKLVEDVRGHALTLNLLGSYLREAHAGDIRRCDRVKLEEADREERNGHAFHVMDAYVRWFEQSSPSETKTSLSPSGGEGRGEGENGKRALALLRLLGLFDRPAEAGCLDALLRPPAITGLTDAFFTAQTRWFGLKRTYLPINNDSLNLLITRLDDAKLLSPHRDAAFSLLSVDAHPLLREYFAAKLRESCPEAWRAGHERLYRHLCETTQDKDQPRLEDLQALYQAVAHGCWAGLQQQACDAVYYARIVRRGEAYTVKKLGAFGAELGAVACFFDAPWNRVSPALTEADQAWLLNQAACWLRGLGRLAEALEPMRSGLEMRVKQEAWKSAAIIAANLSELELSLGKLTDALKDAEQSVAYADRSGDAFQRTARRTALADAQHQAGNRDEADRLLQEAEAMQAERQLGYPRLYSLQGFQYCDRLLAAAERAAWRALLPSPSGRGAGGEGFRRYDNVGSIQKAPHPKPLPPGEGVQAACQAVSERAAQTLQWVESWKKDILSIALDHLTLARAALYATCLAPSVGLPAAHAETLAAVDGLRRAGSLHHLPRGLLTRAWLRRLEGALTGPDSAQEDLDEAYEIAERGPMPLFLADIHLHRARLFGSLPPEACPYPWQSAADDLREARRLIEQHGYGRRKEELEDAEAALRQEP
jgi:hypothetical protein